MNYFNMWRDVWNLQKKYEDIKQDDTYWEALVEESNSICKRYENCEFIQNLVMAVIREIERRYRGMRDNADSRV